MSTALKNHFHILGVVLSSTLVQQRVDALRRAATDIEV